MISTFYKDEWLQWWMDHNDEHLFKKWDHCITMLSGSQWWVPFLKMSAEISASQRWVHHIAKLFSFIKNKHITKMSAFLKHEHITKMSTSHCKVMLVFKTWVPLQRWAHCIAKSCSFLKHEHITKMSTSHHKVFFIFKKQVHHKDECITLQSQAHF